MKKISNDYDVYQFFIFSFSVKLAKLISLKINFPKLEHYTYDVLLNYSQKKTEIN